MIGYLPSEIVKILNPVRVELGNDKSNISFLLTDSRKLTTNESETLFFAIRTKCNSGVRYVKDLYSKGVRNFVVPNYLEEFETRLVNELKDSNIFYVKDSVEALQNLASYHRQQFNVPVVGITGSNGKTIIKDWIVQLLHDDKNIVSSPKSYNSQIGVPLSVWQMHKDAELGIFEAGISQENEMSNIARVINPSIGIFTNIGHAHDENFYSQRQKIQEKTKLFLDADTIIFCKDHVEIDTFITQSSAFENIEKFTWSRFSNLASVFLKSESVGLNSTVLTIEYKQNIFSITIPFSDKASIENAMHCISFLLYLGYSSDYILSKVGKLTAVEMRLELVEGINNCLLINDGYSLDLNSLAIALDFMKQDLRHSKKTLIMSDIMQSGIEEELLYSKVAKLLELGNISKFIGIGKGVIRNSEKFTMDSSFFETTDDFIKHSVFSAFQNETILLKGARYFEFERIAKLLQRRTHQTIMEVNLQTLVDNLNYYRMQISSKTKLMAMVKAFSYGTGNVEIANALQFHNVDYLTVAYTDEAIDLRKSGITLPIMIMNPEEESFDDIIRYNLEPDIYSFRILDLFTRFAEYHCLKNEKIPIHIELDTGMHRLGFIKNDITKLIEKLKNNPVVEVKSVFSHLACSEDAEMDTFTKKQISDFKQWSGMLKDGLENENLCCHILNSSGIVRFPDAEMDMVRLGIGLYGIAPQTEVQKKLGLVARLTTRISQIKEIEKGDTVGYGCRWKAPRDSKIAIIPIGYADGLNRKFGNGVGKVEINGYIVPIIGVICMDMCFLDVTDIPCNENDEVIIFGNAKLLQEMSKEIGTIPYEILTSVSQRVKRIYLWE